MIDGIIKLFGFHYNVGDGKTTDGKIIRVLALKDASSGFQLQIAMSPEEAERLGADLQYSQIIPAHVIPQ